MTFIAIKKDRLLPILFCFVFAAPCVSVFLRNNLGKIVPVACVLVRKELLLQVLFLWAFFLLYFLDAWLRTVENAYDFTFIPGGRSVEHPYTLVLCVLVRTSRKRKACQ